MARAFGDPAGGILSLDALVEEHRTAIESDLIDRGLRLRHLCADGHDLNWSDLRAIVDESLPEAAIFRRLNPKEWQWFRLENLLLAEAVDALRLSLWTKTTDAQKGRNRPKPIPRPGVKSDAEKIGDSPIPISEMNEFLGWEAA